MATTINDATPQRPEGNRTLNAPLVHMDVNKYVAEIRSEQTWAESERNAITIYKSDAMRIVLIGLHKNAALKTHTADGTISVHVIEGKISFTAEEQTVLLEKGQIIALQEKIPHSVYAEEESFFLLTLALRP